jgi:hypothetical protein
MRHSLRAVLAGAFLAAGAALYAGGAAAQSYPRVTCSGGDNCSVDYGPMGQGTVVGGGRIMVTRMDGMNFDFVHLDMMFSQTPREGFVPLQIGSGESQEIVWVPRAMIEMMRNARRGMPSR